MDIKKNIKTFNGDLFEIKCDGTIHNIKNQIQKYNYNFIRLFYLDSNEENKELVEDEHLKNKETDELFLVMSVDIDVGLECDRRNAEKYELEFFCCPSHFVKKENQYYFELLYFPLQNFFIDINYKKYNNLESVIEQNINYPETQKQILKDIITHKWKFYKNKYNLCYIYKSIKLKNKIIMKYISYLLPK